VKQEASDEVEQKISALQGQVALLQSLADDLKSDKIESKEREIALQDQLKESVAQSAEARASLRALQGSHGTDVEKLRLSLETLREKTLLEAQQARDREEAQSRNLVDRDAKITELKARVQELTESGNRSKEELKKNQDDTKQQLLSLSVRAQELETERQLWQQKQIEYEQKISDLGSQLGAANIQLSESEHKHKMGNSSKGEIEVLKAKVAASEKSLSDRSKAFDRQAKIQADEAKAERDAMENEYKRQIKQRDEQAKAQNEAHKYKLQYLELSQKDIKNERKRWQDKEKEFERTLVTLAGELRELRSEHTQAVEVHEAFRAHTEAKEAARQAEASNWEIKKQSLQAEHKLTLRQVEVEKNARIAQLERELHKVKDELNDAMDEIEKLSEAVASGGGAEPAPSYEARTPTAQPKSPTLEARSPTFESKSPAPEQKYPEPAAAAIQPQLQHLLLRRHPLKTMPLLQRNHHLLNSNQMEMSRKGPFKKKGYGSDWEIVSL